MERVIRCGIVLFLALSTGGCADFGLPTPNFPKLWMSWGDTDTPYRLVSRGQSWISVPESQVVVEREVGGEIQQIVALPSTTSIGGEDQIVLFAVPGRSAPAGRLQFQNVKRRLGGDRKSVV